MLLLNIVLIDLSILFSEVIGNCVVRLCSSSSNSSSKIRSFPKIFLGTFENVAPESEVLSTRALLETKTQWR